MYVIYDETTSCLVLDGKTYKTEYMANRAAVLKIRKLLKLAEEKLAGCKGASETIKSYYVAQANRLKDQAVDIAADWSVVTLDHYNANVRKTKKVVNLMSGKEIEIDINTPASCDPSTETYWSM